MELLNQDVGRGDSHNIRHLESVMGTVVSFDLRNLEDPPEARRGLARAVAWLHHVDATFSTFKLDSELVRLQRSSERWKDCSTEMNEVLGLARDCEERTGGAYNLRWRPDGAPDPTGIVKGWAADRASLILTAAGAGSHCVNAAGDVRVAGHPTGREPWSTGIAHPLYRGLLVAVVEATDVGIATSGSAERGSHIIDPRSGLPAVGVASVSVIGPSLARADGYATAAVSRGPEAQLLLSRLDNEGWPSLLVTNDGDVWVSPGFPGSVDRTGIQPEIEDSAAND